MCFPATAVSMIVSVNFCSCYIETSLCQTPPSIGHAHALKPPDSAKCCKLCVLRSRSSVLSHTITLAKPTLTSPLTITLESNYFSWICVCVWVYAWSTNTWTILVIIVVSLTITRYKAAPENCSNVQRLFFLSLRSTHKRKANDTIDYLGKLCKYLLFDISSTFRFMFCELTFSDWKWQCKSDNVDIEGDFIRNENSHCCKIVERWNKTQQSKTSVTTLYGFRLCRFIHLHVNFMSFLIFSLETFP